MTLLQFFTAMYDLILEKLKEQAMSYLTIVVVTAYLYIEQGKYRERIEQLLIEVRKCEVENAELRTQVQALQTLHYQDTLQQAKPKTKRKR